MFLRLSVLQIDYRNHELADSFLQLPGKYVQLLGTGFQDGAVKSEKAVGFIFDI